MKFEVLLTILCALGCNGAHHEDPPLSVAASEPGVAHAVEVITVTAKPLDAPIHLQGELTPYEAVSIFARVNGFVSTVRVDRGSRVKKGQLLITLVAPELNAQRAEAEAKLSGDLSTFDRLRGASATPGAVSAQELELAQVAMKGDRARLESLRALEQYLVVTAPFDGIITERDVHPGALVGPQGANSLAPMLRIEQIAKLRLTVAVPEILLGALSEGTQTTFTTRAFTDTKFTGTVRRTAHSVDVRTRTMPVELDVDNHDGRLAPGMFADVYWHAKRSEPSIRVPPSCIVQSTEKTFVVRVNDGIVEQVSVQRGLVQPNQVEIFGNLRSGDILARVGSEELRDGMHVTPRLQKADGFALPTAGSAADGGVQ